MPNDPVEHAGKSFPVFLLVIGLLALLLAWRIPPSGLGQNADPGPHVFPIALSIFLIAGGLFELGKLLVHRHPAPQQSGPRLRIGERIRLLFPVLLLPLALAVYLLVIPSLGFFSATFLLALVMIGWLGHPWWKAAFYAFCLIAAVYLLFVRIFKVPLPGGTLFG